MVLNNVTKFQVRERTSSGQTYVITYIKYGWTGVTINAPAIIMAGA